MKKKSFLLSYLLILFCLPINTLFAQDNPVPKTDEKDKSETKSIASVTRHSIQIDGKNVNYSATVGWLILKNEKKEPVARFGYTAYVKSDIIDKTQRPIIFAFNGGPGSSSIWLHLGGLGPKRVVVNDTSYTPSPPYKSIDNNYSIIDVADLVMIDPVGTGYSKPLGEAKKKDFWGVDQDIKSVSGFIEKYVTETGRWVSPKYILGESYGGMRAAGLVWYLQNDCLMNFNGVVLVSPFLNFISNSDGYYLDEPYMLFFPSLAAAAWYHNLIPDKPENLEAFLKEVEEFAYNEYGPALMKGFTIALDEKKAIAEKMGAYTGTDIEYWMKADLRVVHTQFLQELMRNEERITGRLDARFTGSMVDPLNEDMDYDPCSKYIGHAFKAALLDYFRNDLDFKQSEEYKVTESIGSWDWKHKPPSSFKATFDDLIPWPDLRPDLSMAMITNPGLNVMVMQGYYDLATPLCITKYDISHLDIPLEAQKRIHWEYYYAGHMMYLHEPSLKKFKNDLVSFINNTDGL